MAKIIASGPQGFPINILAQPVSTLSGVGEATALALQKAQIFSLFDLLLHAPKNIVKQEHSPGLSFVEPGKIYIITARVSSQRILGIGRKQRLEAILEDGSGHIAVVYFGPAVNYAARFLKTNLSVTLAGEVKEFLGRKQMIHPRLLNAKDGEAALPEKLASYSQIGGLSPSMLKRVMDKALAHLKQGGLSDHLEPQLLQKYGMGDLKESILEIHEPTIAENIPDRRGRDRRFRRLAFEELLSFFLRLNQHRASDVQRRAKAIARIDIDDAVDGLFSFSLTGAQQRAIEEIIDDMSRPVAMARLLQGDVGAGKTAVSLAISHHVAKEGLQVAVMAPTEILAEQLYRVFSGSLAEKGYRIDLLTANTKGRARNLLRHRVAEQDIDILIGTHALLSDDIRFNNLALLIIDEQHRFGVNQRAHLLEDTEGRLGHCPHLLVMSATPIPRSLALTLYGDLEISVLDERPQGRIPIHTQIITGAILPSIERLSERVIATNQKAFIVFPLIEESEKLDLQDAKNALVALQKKFGRDSAQLLHGKMKQTEKAQVMEAFRSNSFSLLVSTTVVEVGIDIPDATCMIIVHPERFGLAQLHQLRGRVGRGTSKSFCFLVSDNKNRFGIAFKRLNAMCKSDDGFSLAKIDLETRGPGELLGTKQSGLPNFLIFDHSEYADLVSVAKATAKAIATRELSPIYHHLIANRQAHFS